MNGLVSNVRKGKEVRLLSGDIISTIRDHLTDSVLMISFSPELNRRLLSGSNLLLYTNAEGILLTNCQSRPRVADNFKVHELMID